MEQQKIFGMKEVEKFEDTNDPMLCHGCGEHKNSLIICYQGEYCSKCFDENSYRLIPIPSHLSHKVNGRVSHARQ